MTSPPASRNAPCPCGSGRRFKDCHGGWRDAAEPTAPASFPANDRPSATTPAGAEIVALLARARMELAAGENSAAITTCRAAVAQDRSNAAGWNLLGEGLRTTDPDQAADAWRSALAVDPPNAEAHFHLGNLYRERNELQTAIAEYESALGAAPDNAAVLNNLGLALEASGERDRALVCYRHVLAIDPSQADALGNLANAQFDRNDFSASAESYDRLFAIRTDLPVATLLRRAIALQKSHRLEEAEACFRGAAARAPDDAQILTNIGSLCVEQARYGDAESPLARAVELDPANPYALAMLAHARQHRCQWQGIGELFAALQRLLDATPHELSWSVAPFPLHAMPLPARTHLRAARQWARALHPGPLLPHRGVRAAPDGRLRVGFVSSDFRSHPVASLLTEVWERIDRGRLETFAYGIMPADTGPVGRRIAQAFEHFADVSAEHVNDIAQHVRSDGIAILFDLNGYTQNAKPEIFALRPAPLQINSMGFPGTLGADWYDYIHVDHFVAPAEMHPYYSEHFFHMPHAYVPSDTRRAPGGAAPSRSAVGLPDKSFVFCCFNNTFKLLPEVFAVWMRLLSAVPDSVLWLLGDNADATANLRREMNNAGVDPARLIFAPRVENAQHLARTAVADLFLDTSPYGAHTTTNDALLVGLPVVTCAGDTLASRNPGSQLRAIGLPEMVTSTFDEYEALALRLALDPGALASVRARLVENRSTYPLFDMARYARDLEDGLLRLWRDYETGAEAASR
jgi:predicted O-linked N-acetylglucosamine transferase (SPINDLY family)